MGRKSGWTYCNCAGSHDKNCPNAGKADALPPLKEDENDKKDKKRK